MYRLHSVHLTLQLDQQHVCVLLIISLYPIIIYIYIYMSIDGFKTDAILISLCRERSEK